MLLMLLTACGTGPLDLSQIADTRVMAIIAEPPEAGPGETFDLTVTVADPKERGVELLVWACTDYGPGCIEAEAGELADWAAVPDVVDGQAVLSRRIPSEAADVLGVVTDEIPARIWALACEPDLCPIIDEVREALLLSGWPNEEVEGKLADPSAWMVELPMEGVSLATKDFKVSRRSVGDRNENPLYEARFVGYDDEVLQLDRGGELEISFASSDPNADRVYGFAYTTAGRFEDRTERVSDGAIRFYLLAPTTRKEGEIYIIFDDEQGGAALYRKRVEIR